MLLNLFEMIMALAGGGAASLARSGVLVIGITREPVDVGGAG